MLSAAEALERVLASAQALPEQRVGLHAACDRVLAEDVFAPAPLPPADTSAMDGYALSADECRGPGPYRLPVVGESRAGEPFVERLAGGACRIFTGAWLPEGADAVVLQEDVERERGSVVFRERPEALQNVRRRGEDIAAGAQVMRAGTWLNPFHVGLLASVEYSEVRVARRPRVGILATGSELRSPGSEAVPGSIAESNSFAIAALARRAGAETRVADRIADELASTEAAIGALLEDCDLLVTIGGVSVGDHDLVRPALERAGVSLDFWKVAIKPGKPLVFGRKGSSLVLGLPGNPVSAQVTFCLFGLPLLKRMQGAERVTPVTRSLSLTAALRQATGRRGFHRVTISGNTATPVSGQSSGSVASMARADGLAIVSEQLDGIAAGQTVEVIAFADL